MKKILGLWIVLTLALVLTGAIVRGQNTPEPTTEATAEPEPVAVDTTTTTTTTTTAPLEDIGLTLTWAIAFVTLWQAAGIAYAVTVEKTLKPALYSLVDMFTSDVRVRHAVLILAVIAGAFTAVQSGGINLFADAPFGLFTDAAPSFMLVLNSLFVAAGAFMGHEIWQTLESYLKKAKAVADVLSPRPAARTGDSGQSARSRTVDDL